MLVAPFFRVRPTGFSLGRKHSRGKTGKQTFFLINFSHYTRQCRAINTAVEPIKGLRQRNALSLLYRRSFLPVTCPPLDLVPLPTCRLMRRDRDRNRKESAIWFSGTREGREEAKEGGRLQRKGEKENARERRRRKYVSLKANQRR